MRRGELCGLAWSDLDPTARTLTVQRTLQYHPGERRPRLFPTKTQASDRRLALPEPCLAALERWRHAQDTERQTAGEDRHDSGLIFTQPDGQPLDPTRLTKHFRQLLDQAGLRRIRLHDLRHSCATLLLDQGVELVVIKELLGHAHIGVTATVYAHVRLRLQHQALDTLGRILDVQKHDQKSLDDSTPPDDDHDDEPPMSGILVR